MLAADNTRKRGDRLIREDSATSAVRSTEFGRATSQIIVDAGSVGSDNAPLSTTVPSNRWGALQGAIDGPMTFTTYDFDSGTDGATIAAGTHGIDTISGTPRYEIDAAVHGALGVEMVGTSQFMRYVVGPTNSGSIYYKAVTFGTGSNRFITWGTSINGTNASLRCQSTGNFSITDAANTQIGANFLTTWTGGDVFRFDWQYSETGTAPTISCLITLRVFKGANIEGTTPDEEITRSVPSTTSTARLRLASSTAGWTSRVDTLRLSPLLEWATPFAPSVGYTPSHWNGDAWIPLTPSLWTGTTWIPLDVDYTPPLPIAVYTYEGMVDGDLVPAGANGVVTVNNSPRFSSLASYHNSLGVRCVDTANYIYNASGLAHSFSIYTRQVATAGAGSDRSIAYIDASNTTIMGFRFSIDNERMGVIDSTGTLIGGPTGTKWTLGEWFRIDGQLTRSVEADYVYTLLIRIYRFKPDGYVPSEELTRSVTTPQLLTGFRLGSTRNGCAADFDTLRFTNEARWFEPYAP